MKLDSTSNLKWLPLLLLPGFLILQGLHPVSSALQFLGKDVGPSPDMVSGLVSQVLENDLGNACNLHYVNYFGFLGDSGRYICLAGYKVV